MNDYSELIRRVFGNVLSGMAKMHDAPASSQMHFDAAIDVLASATTWRPENQELREIVDSAVAAMKLARERR